MNVLFACPHCSATVRSEAPPQTRPFVCPHCALPVPTLSEPLDQGQLNKCLICPSTDLFVRKDFPQRLGVAIVAVGILASSVAWGFQRPLLTYAILFATALLDVVLYFVVPNALMCYRCGAQYRDVPGIDSHGAFDLETHERHRQHQARLKQAQSAAHLAKANSEL